LLPSFLKDNGIHEARNQRRSLCMVVFEEAEVKTKTKDLILSATK